MQKNKKMFVCSVESGRDRFLQNVFFVFGFLFLFVPNLLATLGTNDPLQIGAGARPLGMGKAGIAYFNDGTAAFMAPANLGFIDSVKAISMTTQVLESVDYQLLGVVLPMEGIGSIGIGYIGSTVPDIALGLSTAVVNGRLDRTLLTSASVYDQVILLSFGRQLNSSLSLGVSGKYFNKGFTGSTLLTGYSATGFDMDFGMLWKLNKNLKVAGVVQNFLANNGTSLGGVAYQTGQVDNIDAIFKLGVNYSFFNNRWQTVFDLEKNLDQPSFPWLIHTGVEWQPVNQFFLRAGVDQIALPPDISAGQTNAGTQTDFTLGVGLGFSGLRFDYAYHPYGDVQNLNTHYFSLSLVGNEGVTDNEEPSENIKSPEVVPTPTQVILLTPVDHLVTYEKTVEVSGQMTSKGVLQINGVPAVVDAKGNFNKVLPIKLGLNEVKVTMHEGPAAPVKKVLRLAAFNDVPRGANTDAITALSTLGLIKADGDGFFNPKRIVSRVELADALVKIKNYELPDGYKGVFDNVEMINSQGLIQGYPNGKLLPANQLTRAQLAVVLARLEGYQDPATKTPGVHWAQGSIDFLVSRGNYQPSDFMPYNQPVIKEEFSNQLYKTTIVKNRVAKLYNFEEGEFSTPVDYQTITNLQEKWQNQNNAPAIPQSPATSVPERSRGDDPAAIPMNKPSGTAQPTPEDDLTIFNKIIEKK